jgi:hypothetical protein
LNVLWRLHGKFLSTSDGEQQVYRLNLWQCMKHGYICIIQETKNNNLRSGDTVVLSSKKVLNT